MIISLSFFLQASSYDYRWQNEPTAQIDQVNVLIVPIVFLIFLN